MQLDSTIQRLGDNQFNKNQVDVQYLKNSFLQYLTRENANEQEVLLLFIVEEDFLFLDNFSELDFKKNFFFTFFFFLQQKIVENGPRSWIDPSL